MNTTARSIVVSIVTLAACAAASAQTATIDGLVFDDLGDPAGSGLAGVEVTLDDGVGGIFMTLTGDTPAGVWSIADVPLGSYTVTATLAGTCFQRVVDAVGTAHAPFLLQVDADATVDLLAFTGACDDGLDATCEDTCSAGSCRGTTDACCKLYDINGDGIVNVVGDVNPLVECLFFGNCGPDVCPTTGCLCRIDCDCSGFISLVGDVPCFVDCLFFGDCQTCDDPEPDALEFSQSNIAFNLNPGDPAAMANVDLTSAPTANLGYTLSSDQVWATATPDMGTTPANLTVTADPTGLASGVYDAEITASATDVPDVTLNVQMRIDGLQFTPASLIVGMEVGDAPVDSPVDVSTILNSAASYTIVSSAAWLSASPLAGTTPQTLTVTVDPAGLTSGTYNGMLTVSAAGFDDVDLPVELNLAEPCPATAKADMLVDLPYHLEFDEDAGFVFDASGQGTGFTYIDCPSGGGGFIPSNLVLDTTAGELTITTTAGLHFEGSNSLVNAIGVGIDIPSQLTRVSTTLVDIPVAQFTNNFEQAGLWFGNDEDNYVKLVVISTEFATEVELLIEIQGNAAGRIRLPISITGSDDVELQMEINPSVRTITGLVSINGGATTELGSFVAPPEFFSFDAARVDPMIGTDSFAGIYASHRNAAGPLEFTFDGFWAEALALPPVPGQLPFAKVQYELANPTSMVWGPDDRLYVTQLDGTIHALTFNASWIVTDDEVITSLTNDGVDPRLALGIAIDPSSGPANVILWVSHSNSSLTVGEINSGKVTRLSGPGFATVEDVITGLPRALANHAINSIKFGPDGQLYIAAGGNTGGGAPNVLGTEFGDRAEQPLSSALLVADVNGMGFNGDCDNMADPYGPPGCDVMTYCTGLRNTYDFVCHSNGSIYAPDNGLSVAGTFPPSPTPSCFGFGNPDSYLIGGHSPGPQNDLFNRLIEGQYYGHPNPSRGECVYKDGSYQGVAAPLNYEPPMIELGMNKAPTGAIEYTDSSRFCGDLSTEVLFNTYSTGDNITRVRLSEDGLTVIQSSVLVAGFDDPLPLATGPDGVIFVGEFDAGDFDGGYITTLIPLDLGCWSIGDFLPEDLLDAGGGAVNGEFYSVAGKNPGGPINSVYALTTNGWLQRADLPGPAVENPAIVQHGGLLYAFGGSTEPFSGAVTNTASYDPAVNMWTELNPMPTARGGTCAAEIDGLIYVVGGLDATGASVDTVEIFDPSTGLWAPGVPLTQPRDNPGCAAVDGILYVFGGRERLSDGTEIDPTLATTEAFDPNTDMWSPMASMSVGRRTFACGVIDGKILAAGGERKGGGSGTFDENEEYDPVTDAWRQLTSMRTGRHGMAGAVLDGQLITAGGGPSGGGSFSNIVEIYTPGVD